MRQTHETVWRKEVEPARVRTGEGGTDPSIGRYGLFIFPNGIKVVCSEGEGWDHVSASREDRIPSWEDMCWVRDLFWGSGECVMQLHPPHHDYINNHPRVLHLWKPQMESIPRPPGWMVGIKEAGQLVK